MGEGRKAFQAEEMASEKYRRPHEFGSSASLMTPEAENLPE